MSAATLVRLGSLESERGAKVQLILFFVKYEIKIAFVLTLHCVEECNSYFRLNVSSG